MPQVSGYFFPVIRVAFYGQHENDEWFRKDIFIPVETSGSTIEELAKKIREENSLKYVSWGIDNRLTVMDMKTGCYETIANMPFIDIDIKAKVVTQELNSIITTLRIDGYVRTSPTIISSENGFHLYYFDSVTFERVMAILNHPVFDGYVCSKFKRSTFALKGSVLRLSNYKKGNESDLIPLVLGTASSEFTESYMSFVHNILAGY